MIDIGKNNIVLYDDYGEIIIHSPTHGNFNIKIDLEDIDIVEKYRWCINKYIRKDVNTEGTFYTVGKVGLLHRFLMNNPKGKIVDHINRDSTDCRKNNLRVCTASENMMNSKIKNTNTSGYKGVMWNKWIHTPKWNAYIMFNWKYINLGYFDDIEDAIKARKDAEQKYFGEYSSAVN